VRDCIARQFQPDGPMVLLRPHTRPESKSRVPSGTRLIRATEAE
jgi:hypothetical protein